MPFLCGLLFIGCHHCSSLPVPIIGWSHRSHTMVSESATIIALQEKKKRQRAEKESKLDTRP